MVNLPTLSKNEEGFVLIVSMLMMVVLSLIGTFALTTSRFESQISGNDREAKVNFYTAEGGWNCGFQWLENMISAPDRVNASVTDPNNDNYDLVKNFGDGTDGTFNDTFPDSSEDGTLGLGSIPYWYQLADMTNVVPGAMRRPVGSSGKHYKNFFYQIQSNADGKQEITVVAEKVFKIGYN